jgi:hypothetical protein
LRPKNWTGVNHSSDRLIMDTPSPSTRDLARRLLAVEAASQSATDPRAHEAVRVCEKLRVSLTRFAGADGFTALLRRALALARLELPSLHGITEKADGSMEGLEELTADERIDGIDAAVTITTHLLGLLVTLIGEPLTMRLELIKAISTSHAGGEFLLLRDRGERVFVIVDRCHHRSRGGIELLRFLGNK